MSTHPTPLEALRLAVSHAGTQSAFARDLGVSQAAVWKWLHHSERMPAEYVLKAERRYGVSRHLLRPDIYPLELPPFAPEAATVATSTGKRPCDRQPNLQRGEEAKTKPTAASATKFKEPRS